MNRQNYWNFLFLSNFVLATISVQISLFESCNKNYYRDSKNTTRGFIVWLKNYYQMTQKLISFIRQIFFFDARRQVQFNISPLPNFPIFVKFCLRRSVHFASSFMLHFASCQICNFVKFCELTNFEFIGNFWRPRFLVLKNLSNQKNFLGWDCMLPTKNWARTARIY